MTILRHVIRCMYSGAIIGTLDYVTCAGHMPYLSHWKEAQAMHPVFSLPPAKLLAFARSEYDRIAALDNPSDSEEELLSIAFLALLHSLGSVHQEAPSLPPIHLVQTQMPRLFHLAAWKHYLESKRFYFPEFKINALNSNDRFQNIQYYIDACFERRAEYESGVKEATEKAKLVAAEKAMLALRNSWVVPVSRKELWRWVRAHLPERYQADAEGWMGTIFLGNDRTVLDFDADEVDMMQHIIEGECPQGTAILSAVRSRLDHVRNVIKLHSEAFEVNYEQVEDAAPDAVAPKQSDFLSLAAFYKAKAVWFLQQRKKDKQQ